MYSLTFQEARSLKIKLSTGLVPPGGSREKLASGGCQQSLALLDLHASVQSLPPSSYCLFSVCPFLSLIRTLTLDLGPPNQV